MDDSNEDQRLPHHREPKEFVSLDKLAGKICVFVTFCKCRTIVNLHKNKSLCEMHRTWST